MEPLTPVAVRGLRATQAETTMSTVTYYTFFDREAMDPVWRKPWKDFLRQHPRSRAEMKELFRFGFNSDGGEPSDEELADIFERRTLAWTIRRSTPQFYLISEVMARVPALRPHSLDIRSGYTEDCFALVAVAIEGWVRAAWGERTVRAVLKIHNFDEPGVRLDLPKRLAARVKALIPPKVLAKPLYPWQGPEACECMDGSDYWGDNCLAAADTRRFIAFLEHAWAENRAVPYLEANDSGGMSVDPSAGKTVRFRDVDLAQGLVGKLGAVRRLGEPSALRVLS